MGSVGFIIVGLTVIVAVTLIILRVLNINECAQIRADEKENAE